MCMIAWFSQFAPLKHIIACDIVLFRTITSWSYSSDRCCLVVGFIVLRVCSCARLWGYVEFMLNKRGHWIKRTLIFLIRLKIRSRMPSDLNAIKTALKWHSELFVPFIFVSHCWVPNNTIKLETILWWDQGHWWFYQSQLQYNLQRLIIFQVILKWLRPTHGPFSETTDLVSTFQPVTS